MKHIKRAIFGLLFSSLFFSSCSNDSDKDIDIALRQAGKNRSELEKVLSYYSDPADSLKKKAAHFLIRNMFAYYCHTSDSLEKYSNFVFEQIRGKTHNYTTAYNAFASAKDSIYMIGGNKAFKNLQKKYDCEELTADFLIQNIEYAFKAWNNNPWATDVSFDNFCRYVLPYRVASEPVDINRAELFSRYTEIAYGCENINNPQEVYKYMVNKKFIKYHWLVESLYPSLMSIKNSELLGIGSCVHTSIYNAMILRAIGLPVTVDYTPHWGNYRGNHYMPKLIIPDTMDALLVNNNSNSSIENSKFEMSFDSKVVIPPDSLPFEFSVQYIKTVPKIYRKTQVIQPERRYLLENPDRDRTGLFSDVCEQDVTDEYLACSDITISVGKKGGEEKIAYLCVFGEGGEWIPVCAAPIIKGNVSFGKMGRMIVYITTVYEDGMMGLCHLRSISRKRKKMCLSNRTSSINLR